VCVCVCVWPGILTTDSQAKVRAVSACGVRALSLSDGPVNGHIAHSAGPRRTAGAAIFQPGSLSLGEALSNPKMGVGLATGVGLLEAQGACSITH
jgi:hypothetical protein